MSRLLERRCHISGNLCGTDTWAKGHPCTCNPCHLWLYDEGVRLRSELAEAKAANDAFCQRYIRVAGQRDAAIKERDDGLALGRQRQALSDRERDAANARAERLERERDEARRLIEDTVSDPEAGFNYYLAEELMASWAAEAQPPAEPSPPTAGDWDPFTTNVAGDFNGPHGPIPGGPTAGGEGER